MKNKIFKDTRLDCNQYKDPYLMRRFNVRMRATGVKTYEEYTSVLTKTPDEYDNLLSEITINVTQFFRDTMVFKSLREDIIPLLIYEKCMKNDVSIKIWSAGCSSGEEPYSMAIMLHDLLGEEFDHFKVTIVASDIDDEVLEAARIGTYLARQVVNVPKDLLARYFTKEGDLYCVNDEIKRMVQLKKVDLFSQTGGFGFDMILCRNVVIYFNREMQDKLYMKFVKALRPGGYFVMGNTETLVGEATQYLESIRSRERIYQKSINDDYQK
ncbi:MAG: protein-glutamate O-methyltransferase CheR [Methanomassiliicoccales archaeon]|nr:protein-glutamate O-methyltransferase CheR [Methanomassiliicoccales archaeon]